MDAACAGEEVGMQAARKKLNLQVEQINNKSAARVNKEINLQLVLMK